MSWSLPKNLSTHTALGAAHLSLWLVGLSIGPKALAANTPEPAAIDCDVMKASLSRGLTAGAQYTHIAGLPTGFKPKGSQVGAVQMYETGDDTTISGTLSCRENNVFSNLSFVVRMKDASDADIQKRIILLRAAGTGAVCGITKKPAKECVGIVTAMFQEAVANGQASKSENKGVSTRDLTAAIKCDVTIALADATFTCGAR